MRSETKRITGGAMIELRREMIAHPDVSDALISVLLAEIDRLKHGDTIKSAFARVEHLRASAAQGWAKVDHLKVQMYKMSKGYEKKIRKLQDELEYTPIP